MRAMSGSSPSLGPSPASNHTCWPSARGDQQDVGEDDGRIERKPAHWLQGGFRRHLGIVAEGDEVAGPRPELAVLRQRPAGLAHQPDRRPIEGFTGQGAQQAGRLAHGRLKSPSAPRLKPTRADPSPVCPSSYP
jgi:hypothetical protein